MSTEQKKQDFRPDFFLIPYKVIKDRRIVHIDMLVYAAIYWFYGMKEGRCFASNETLGELVNAHKNTVGHSLNRLIKYGYVVAKYKDKSKRHRKELVPKVVFGKSVDQPRGGSRSTYKRNQIRPQADRTIRDNYNNKLYSSSKDLIVDKPNLTPTLEVIEKHRSYFPGRKPKTAIAGGSRGIGDR